MNKQIQNTETQRYRGTERFFSLRRLCVFVSLCYAFGLAGCVPARTPPLLNFTPGPPAVITDETFSNSAFSVRYPTGWRVVTGAADAPPSVVFVAPDEESTITLQVEPPGEPERDPLFRLETRLLSLGDLRLYAVARAPVQEWAAFQPTFERLLASVRPGG